MPLSAALAVAGLTALAALAAVAMTAVAGAATVLVALVAVAIGQAVGGTRIDRQQDPESRVQIALSIQSRLLWAARERRRELR